MSKLINLGPTSVELNQSWAWTLKTHLGNHQNVGWGNWFPRVPLYDFLTRTVRTPQAQIGWGITWKWQSQLYPFEEIVFYSKRNDCLTCEIQCPMLCQYCTLDNFEAFCFSTKVAPRIQTLRTCRHHPLVWRRRRAPNLKNLIHRTNQNVKPTSRPRSMGQSLCRSIARLASSVKQT